LENLTQVVNECTAEEEQAKAVNKAPKKHHASRPAKYKFIDEN